VSDSNNVVEYKIVCVVLCEGVTSDGISQTVSGSSWGCEIQDG
jgi:hypothetical protein